MTKPKKSKVKTTVNPVELKAWLRGIQEFQPEGWTPTAEQWNAIRERIFLLDEYTQPEQYRHEYTEQPRHASEPAYTAVVPSYAAVPQPQHQPVSSLGSVASSGNRQEAHEGKLATQQSPTESGMIPVSSASEVLEGNSRSKFL